MQRLAYDDGRSAVRERRDQGEEEARRNARLERRLVLLACGSGLRGLLSNKRPRDHQHGTRDLQHRARFAENDDGQNKRDHGVELDHGRRQVHPGRLACAEVAVSAEDEMQNPC